MGKAFLKNTADLLQKKHKRKQWQKIMISLSLVVALLTSCLLIHPAITMSRQATCGQEEHTHTEKCYEKKLICNKEEPSISESSETEGEESVEAHTHSDACYENVLICGKQEHTHSEACYPKEEEKEESTEVNATEEEKKEEGLTTNTEEEKSEDKDVKSEDKAEEKTEEKAEACTLKVDQADYTVEVDCPAEANIPKDAKLNVREIKTGTAEYNGYYEKAQKAVASGDETDISFARFFDISFEVDGKEIEPEAKVEVKITYDDKVEVPEKGKVKSVHFGNKTEVLDVKTNEKNGKMDEVKFDADSFSVYAIIGTETDAIKPNTEWRTYEFYDYYGNQYNFTNIKGVTTNIQYLTNEGVLYNPGTPTDPVDGKKNLEFLGWYEKNSDGTWANAATLKSGEDYANIDISGITSGESVSVKLYARYKTVYYLVYHDEDSNVYSTVKVDSQNNVSLYDSDGKINVDYQPSSSTQAFLGWSTKLGQQEEKDVVKSVSFSEDNGTINLYPVMANVYWINFDKNDVVDGKTTGASYVKPRYVLQGETVESRYDELPTSTRPGYVFSGWYTNKECSNGNEFSLSSSTPHTLTSDITLYAKWEPANQTYTVIFWRQSETDAVGLKDSEKKYVYDHSDSRTAVTGSTVQTTSTDRSTTSAGTGFSYNSSISDTSATVAADGSTVLNVYYDRNTYTFTFIKGIKKTKIHTVKALYGADISGIWSFKGTDGVTYPETDNVTSWTPTNSNTYTQRITRMEIMPAENITFSLTNSNNQTRYFHYYVEALEGATDTITYNEIKYSLYTDLKHDFNYVYYNDDFWNLKGFTRQVAATSNGKVVKEINSNNRSVGWSTINNYGGTSNHLYFYYTRNSYNLEFWDSTTNTQIGNSISVKYRAPLSKYESIIHVSSNKQTLTYGDITVSHEGYQFTGWYEDPECTKLYDFSSNSMPANAVKVYAGWTPLKYKVWIQPNGGELSSEETTFITANYGDQIQEYTDVKNTRNYYESSDGEYSYVIYDHTNPGNAYYKETTSLTDEEKTHTDGKTYAYLEGAYEFVGWYKVNGEISETTPPIINENDSLSLWNFGTPITETTAIRAIWKRVGSFAVSYNLSMVLDDGNVISGTNGPDKSNYVYSDRAEAVADHSPVPPEGYIFIGWKTPTGDIVQPEDIFNIYSTYANYVGNDSTSGQPLFTYELTAVYGKIGTTFITYHAGEGASGNLTDYGSPVKDNNKVIKSDNTISNLVLNSEIVLSNGSGFERPGYILVGWNSDEEKAKNGEVEYSLGKTYGVDDENGNHLWAVWKPLILDINFEKINEDGEPISEVSFEIKASLDSSVIQTGTSDSNGQVTFSNLIPGANSSYVIEETTPAPGYVKPTWTLTANNFTPQINSDGSFVTKAYNGKTYIVAAVTLSCNKEGILESDNNGKYTVKNEKKKTDVTIIKTDNASTKLSGVKFQILKEKDAVVIEGVTDQNGYFVITDATKENGVVLSKLSDGEYALKEIVAPDGYIIVDSDIIFKIDGGKVTITSGSKYVSVNGTTITVQNEAGKALPNTGGSGTLPYTLGGLMLMSAAAMMYGFIMRRRGRRLN